MSPRSTLAALLAAAIPVLAQTVNLGGTITDTLGLPVSGATVTLERLAITTTSDANGAFTLSNATPILPATGRKAGVFYLTPVIRAGALQLALNQPSPVTVTAHAPDGRITGTVSRKLEAGVHRLELPPSGTGVRFYRLRAGSHEEVIRSVDLAGSSTGSMVTSASSSSGPLAKVSGGTELIDQVIATKTGYINSYVAVRSSDSSGLQLVLLPSAFPKFSFFVISQKAMQELSGKDSGFGGDFRYGEMGSGAGLRGADKICAAVAERSLKNAKYKGWRAFLSAKVGPYGAQVNAIDRVGPGPWYDRVGRVMAPTKKDLINTSGRPANGDVAIRNDLPNENGIPNQQPDPALPAVDNHHTLTGSSTAGTLQSPNSSSSTTCNDWTTNAPVKGVRPQTGWSWSAQSRIHWISGQAEAGCGAGYNIAQTGGPDPDNPIVGSGGGYGGFYCFALNP
jgi:hypothetical protein